MSLSNSLADYDDYNLFGNYLWLSHSSVYPFLAFDVFNHGSSHRMPYEGFTRQVFPELNEYREENEQEGPPTEWLQECQNEGVEGSEPMQDLELSAEDAAAEAIADDLDSFEESVAEDAS